MGEISMSGSTREREAAVIGLRAFHSVLSSLLYWFRLLLGHLSVCKYANKSVTSVGGIASNNPSGIMLILV